MQCKNKLERDVPKWIHSNSTLAERLTYSITQFKFRKSCVIKSQDLFIWSSDVTLLFDLWNYFKKTVVKGKQSINSVECSKTINVEALVINSPLKPCK